MEKYFVKKWEENKDKLREYFKNNIQDEYDDYKAILKAIITHVFNDNSDDEDYIKIDPESIKSIDYGDYQGTLIFTFAEDTYQPDIDETYYTVWYGSCSGCDTLLGISRYETESLPDDEQLSDYMQLALNIVQNIKCMGVKEYYNNEEVKQIDECFVVTSTNHKDNSIDLIVAYDKQETAEKHVAKYKEIYNNDLKADMNWSAVKIRSEISE